MLQTHPLSLSCTLPAHTDSPTPRRIPQSAPRRGHHPTPLPSRPLPHLARRIVHVAAGKWAVFALTAEGDLFGWGSLPSTDGPATGTPAKSAPPWRVPTAVALPAGATALSVAVGESHVLVLTTDGVVLSAALPSPPSDVGVDLSSPAAGDVAGDGADAMPDAPSFARRRSRHAAPAIGRAPAADSRVGETVAGEMLSCAAMARTLAMAIT